MKGDFSRETFDPKKHYGGVLMQQGRVQLDADWNEQGDIARYHDETEGTDVIGRCGAPIGNAGFWVTTNGQTLFIGAGRFYVDGILVENDLDHLAYDDQSKVDLPGADLAGALAAMAAQNRTLAIVYLDVWRRHVTALDDARLREVALGGADTTTRIRTVWQVRLLPVAAPDGNGDEIGGLDRQRVEIEAKLTEIDRQLAAVDKEIEERGIKLSAARTAASHTRLEKPILRLSAERDLAGKTREKLVSLLDEIRVRSRDLRAVGLPDCARAFPEWDALFAPHGMLNARAQPGQPSDYPCELPPGAGYTRLENQLYRVEVHTPGDLSTATFKWSRDNGTVVTAIDKITGGSVFVDDLGPDDVLGFANGQWVEIVDDARELNGLPGQLAKIVDVKTATNEIVLDPAPTPLAAGATGIDPDLHPKLRRWDQRDSDAAPAGTNGVVTSGTWLPLEDGVEVSFSGGPFATGDYWLIPARTATGDLEWPPFEVPNLAPIAQERRGIVHHYCRLALVEVVRGMIRVLGDCRALFPPLTAIQPVAIPPALHVVATSWENDASVDSVAFFREGLTIRLDAPPDPSSIDNDSILVTVDLPYPSEDDAVPNVRERVVLLGETGIAPADPQTIVWRWNRALGDISAAFRPRLDVVRLRARAAAALREYRVNVTLRGHVIWQRTGRDLFHLDGQAFGHPEVDSATNRVRAALTLPSGAGVRASDFESWFFLGRERKQIDTLRVVKLDIMRSFSGQPDQVIRSVDEFPLDPDQPVHLGPNDVCNRFLVTFSRAVQPEGEFGAGQAAPARVEFEPIRGEVRPMFVRVIVKGDSLDVRLTDPPLISAPGLYHFVVLSANEEEIGIRAADDGSPLDGDYDGEPGANFVLPFTLGG